MKFRIYTVFSSVFILSVFITIFCFIYLTPSRTDKNRLSETGKIFITEELVPNHNEFTYQAEVHQQGDDPLLDAAKKISQKNLTVLVTLINDAYIPFTYSWLCNTKYMNIHKQVLIISSDEKSTEKLKLDWPEISVVYLKGLSSNGDQVYSHAGYVRLMIKRTEALLKLLENNIEMFLFEVDCLWLRNPMTYLQSHKGFDLLVNPVSERPGIVAGGFLFMYPTKATKSIWKALTTQLLKLETQIKALPPGRAISEGQNDQIFLSNLISRKHANIKTKSLPLTEFADGKWYTFPESKRNQLKPYVINNNWALGNKEKFTRAKKWGHWFLKDDNTCNEDQIKKIVVNS